MHIYFFLKALCDGRFKSQFLYNIINIKINVTGVFNLQCCKYYTQVSHASHIIYQIEH